MTYPFVHAWYDYGARSMTLGLMYHMAEGGGTVGYLDDKGTAPSRGVSVHAVCQYDGSVVQMLDWTHASGSLNPADRSTDKAYFGHTHLVDVLGSWWTNPNEAVLSMEIEGFAAQGPNQAQVMGATAWGKDMKSRFPTLRGALGHADQTDTKGCPGSTAAMRAIFDGVGGHGLWEVDVIPSPVTDETPMLVTTSPNSTWYDLDGKTVLASGKPALPLRTSPYAAGTKRAIYATVAGLRRPVLITPASVVPVPPPDCTQPIADAVAAEHERTRSAAIAAVEAL